jgi:hypothetical protein
MIPLHQFTGQNRFLRKADVLVLAYQAKRQAEAKTFFETKIM